MDKDTHFSSLSPEQVNTIKAYEKEFQSKYGQAVYLLAFNQDQHR